MRNRNSPPLQDHCGMTCPALDVRLCQLIADGVSGVGVRPSGFIHQRQFS